MADLGPITATAPIVPAHGVGKQYKRREQPKREQEQPEAAPTDDEQADDGTPTSGKGRVIDDFA